MTSYVLVRRALEVSDDIIHAYSYGEARFAEIKSQLVNSYSPLVKPWHFALHKTENFLQC